MKIKLFGYGKMGKRVHALATKHEIVNAVEEADVAIDFSHKDAVLDNTRACLEVKCPLVIGTTGWMENLRELETLVEESDGTVLYAENFSLGVHAFFRAAEALASLGFPMSIHECHHKEKVDAPSGTALVLARKLGVDPENIISERKADVPGTHTLSLSSPYDEITLQHRAKNRDGFASGALFAAEWLVGKKGLFTIDDLMESLCLSPR